MDNSITNGCWSTKEYLPGSLKVKRRAPKLFKRLMEKSLVRTRLSWLIGFLVGTENIPNHSSHSQPIGPDPIKGQSGAVTKSGGKRKDFPTLTFLDWLSCFAISVNEENACGGKGVLESFFFRSFFLWKRPSTLLLFFSFS